jgi:enoyl-CoA hydratase
MPITTARTDSGIAIVTVDYPPVNALPSAVWFDLADVITAAGEDPSTHVVILRSEGRGFNAGVDIKEMQTTSGFGALIGANHGCAADDAYFGLPEVDRGALGAATHLARLVPQHMMRTLYYTAQTVTAQQLLHFGSVYRVVPADELIAAATEVAEQIAKKDTRVIRAAKAAINHIDPVDVKTSYRLEQGYTFELNLAGVADEHRDAFVATGKAVGES